METPPDYSITRQTAIYCTAVERFHKANHVRPYGMAWNASRTTFIPALYRGAGRKSGGIPHT